MESVPANLTSAPAGHRRGRRALLAGAIALVTGAWSWLDRPDPDVERGNRAVAEGRHQDAQAAYQAALDRRGPDARIHYNLGTALHRQADAASTGIQRERLYDDAEAALRQATRTDDTRLGAAALYNLGNTLFRRGRHGEAIQAYRRALRMNPADDDARYNLELAQRALRGHGTPRPASGQGGPLEQPPGARPDQGHGSRQNPGRGPSGAHEPDGPDQPGEPENSAQQPQSPSGTSRFDAGSTSSQEPGKAPRDAAARDPASARASDADGDTSADRDKKLDALERLSRELHRHKLRRATGRSAAPRSGKDW